MLHDIILLFYQSIANITYTIWNNLRWIHSIGYTEYGNSTCPSTFQTTLYDGSTWSNSNWGKGVKSFVVCKLIIASKAQRMHLVYKFLL